MSNDKKKEPREEKKIGKKVFNMEESRVEENRAEENQVKHNSEQGHVNHESIPVYEEQEFIEEYPDGSEDDDLEAMEARQEWEQEKEELLDRLKRKQAEMDNLRRISKMEQSEAREYALYDFLSRLLPVLDNLERALDSARSDQDVPDSHVAGLEMIYKQLMQILEQEEVKVIEAEGMPFDPHCHHAVMEVESEDSEPGSVVESLQKGYWHRKRILRPAMVKVCRE